MLLHDEGRRSNVGKQNTLCKATLKNITDVTAIVKYCN